MTLVAVRPQHENLIVAAHKLKESDPSDGAGSAEVENLAKQRGCRTVIRMYCHELAHVGPPAAADFRLCNRFPPGLVFDLCVGEELMRLRVEENRVRAYTVCGENALKLRPDRVVPPLVFGFNAGMEGHDEGFADHWRGS